MKLIIKTAKPRNPLVAASLRRMAGAHRTSASAQRQRAERSLRSELKDAADRLGLSP